MTARSLGVLSLAVLGLLAGCAAPRPAGGPIDWEAEGRACADLLKEFIRIDTSDPKTGNETKLCRRVQKLLAAEGIRAEVLESAPGRGNLVARLPGNGSKRPVLLLAHIDVVGVDRGKWEVDPFAAVEKDGVIWGRGALDDKGMAAVIVHAFRLLKRRGEKLSRDVILMLNGDEESAGAYGAQWMVENHFGKIDAEIALNEGGRIPLRDGKVSQFSVQSAEKVYNDVRLWVRGESGHSSVPLADNAIYTLAELLAKLRSFRTPVRVAPTVSAFLAGNAKVPSNAAQRELLERAAAGDVAAAERLAEADPRLNAILRTTIVPTVVKGGFRVNVLPPDVEVNLNIRLLPGDDLDAVLSSVAAHLGLEGIPTVSAKDPEDWKKAHRAAFVVDTRDAGAPASPVESPLMDAIRAVAAETAPGAPLVPFMSTGATDSRFLRAKGMTCYGLLPMPVTEAEEKTFHDHNERVRADSVRFGVEFVTRVIQEVSK